MTSPQSAGSVFKSAICRNDIFPAGRPVVVRIPHMETFLTENRAAVQLRYYPSAAVYSSQAGSDDWSRKLNPLPASGSFFRQGRAGFMNLFGLSQAARSFFCTLRKFCQEPRSVLTILSSPSLFCVVAHAKQQNTGAIPNERNSEARHGNLTARDGKYAC